MGTITNDWDTSWTDDGTVAASTLSGSGGTLTGAAQTLDGKSSVLVSVEATYGATNTGGYKVYILPEYDDSVHLATTDNAQAIEMNYTNSTAHRITFPISGYEHKKFQIKLVNDNSTASASNSVTIRYLFNTITTA